MSGYRTGDARERNSLCVAIDHLIGAAELAKELGDYKTAGEQIQAAFWLHGALRRLERAVVRAECSRAVEKLWPAEWVS